MRALTDRSRLEVVAAAVAWALMVGVTLIAATQTTTLVALTLLAGALGLAAMGLSGNPRLACLWGLMLTAPLELSKRFMTRPHMGGEAAFRVELVDFFLVALLLFLLRDIWRGQRHGLRMPGCLLWWGLLMALGMMAVVLGPFRVTSMHEVVRMGKIVVLVVVVVNEVVRLSQIRHVAAALLAGVAVQSVTAILQYVTGGRLGLEALGEADQKTIDALAEATLRAGEKVHRVGGLIGHANLLAAFLALLLPIAVGLLFTSIKRRWKALCVVTLLLGQAALVLTLSRSGWIAFVASAGGALALSYFHTRMRRRYPLWRVGIVIVSIVVAGALSGPIATRLFRSDPGAVQVRIEWLETAWKMIQEKPVFGFGLNTYVFSQAPYTKEGSNEGLQKKHGDYWPVVHNTYAITWAEQGTVGIVIFLILHGHILWVGVTNLRTKNDVAFAVNAGAMSGVVAVMIDGMASFFLRVPDCARMFWIAVSLIYAVRYWRLLNEPRTGGAIAPTPPAAPAG